jgi:hypothetical protein
MARLQLPTEERAACQASKTRPRPRKTAEAAHARAHDDAFRLHRVQARVDSCAARVAPDVRADGAYSPGMSRRSLVAAALVVTFLSAPASARAEDGEQPPTPLDAEPVMLTAFVPAISLGPRPLLFATRPSSATLAFLAPSPAEIRLSRGAKTAIIVTAIVVGSLLLLGTVVVVSNKHVGP